MKLVWLDLDLDFIWIWLDLGRIWIDFGLDFALSLAFTMIFAYSGIS